MSNTRNLSNNDDESADQLLNIPIEYPTGPANNDLLQYNITTNTWESSSVALSGFIQNGQNVGGANEVFKSKVGTDLTFRTIQSSDASVNITQNADDIDLSVQSVNFGDGTNTDQDILEVDTNLSANNYKLKYKTNTFGNANEESLYFEMPSTGPAPAEISNLFNYGENARISAYAKDASLGVGLIEYGIVPDLNNLTNAKRILHTYSAQTGNINLNFQNGTNPTNFINNYVTNATNSTIDEAILASASVTGDVIFNNGGDIVFNNGNTTLRSDGGQLRLQNTSQNIDISNGIMNMTNTRRITNLLDPIDNQDGATKNYVDGFLPKNSTDSQIVEINDNDIRIRSDNTQISTRAELHLRRQGSVRITAEGDNVNIRNSNQDIFIRNGIMSFENVRRITNLLDPIDNQDGATKNYVDTEISSIPTLNTIYTADDTISGNRTIGGSNITWNVTNYNINSPNILLNGIVNVNNNRIANVATPIQGFDAVNKNYVDNDVRKVFCLQFGGNLNFINSYTNFSGAAGSITTAGRSVRSEVTIAEPCEFVTIGYSVTNGLSNLVFEKNGLPQTTISTGSNLRDTRTITPVAYSIGDRFALYYSSGASPGNSTFTCFFRLTV